MATHGIISWKVLHENFQIEPFLWIVLVRKYISFSLENNSFLSSLDFPAEIFFHSPFLPPLSLPVKETENTRKMRASNSNSFHLKFIEVYSWGQKMLQWILLYIFNIFTLFLGIITR